MGLVQTERSGDPRPRARSHHLLPVSTTPRPRPRERAAPRRARQRALRGGRAARCARVAAGPPRTRPPLDGSPALLARG